MLSILVCWHAGGALGMFRGWQGTFRCGLLGGGRGMGVQLTK